MRVARPVLSLGATLVWALAVHATAIADSEPRPLAPILAPSLTDMEEVVQEQLRQGLSEVLDLARRRDADAAQLAAAYGHLGQLYVAYDLTKPADASLRNAHQLAPEDFRWAYLLGALQQNERRLDEALASYEAALALRPRDLAALIRIGNVHLVRDEPRLARPYFERALDLEGVGTGGTVAAAHAGLGKAAAALGEHEAAVRHFETVLQQMPRATSYHYLLAIALRELGRVEEARRHLEQRGEGPVAFPDPLVQDALQLATGAGIHLMLGQRAIRLGNLEAAVDRFQQAVAANPRNALTHQALGGALAKQGDTEGAVRHYSASLAIEPDNPQLRYNLGTVLVERGEGEQAIRHFRVALEQFPDYHNARFNLATALAKLGHYTEAELHYRKLQETEPRDHATRFFLAQTLFQLGRHRQAVELLSGLVEEDPDRIRARLALAAALVAAGASEAGGASEAAVEQLTAVLALPAAEPAQRVQAHVRLARLRARQGDPGAAMEHYRAVLAIAADHAGAHRGLGETLAREGRFEEAAHHFGVVVDREPGDEASHFGQAMALMMGERYAAARQVLETGRSALPESVSLAHLLARLLAACPDPELRDGERALELALSLFRTHRKPSFAETAAMAFAELGRFDDAVALQRRLILETERAGTESAGGEDLLRRLRHRLAQYERDEACSAPWLSSDPIASDF